ncbi:MAG: FecR domain-containing protein [Bacteroidales bacterium]|nr:FecR domain-containing protein [Bacteroidales bacterium]
MRQLSDKTHLLKKYCEGQLTKQEWQVLQRWMNRHPDNKEHAHRLLKLYRNKRAAEAFDTISHEQAFKSVLERVNKTKRLRRLRWLGSLAASIIVVLTIAILFLLIRKDNVIEQPAVAEQQMIPGSTRATLILSDGQELVLDNYKDSIITSEGGELIQVGDEQLNYQKSSARKQAINIIKTPRGGEYSLLLADGTKVWLNADSELKYPVAFVGNKREITLSGEAYLEVAHNATQPFIVHTSKGAVEVLGTSFNIKDYSDEKQMTTTLVEGKVRLSDKSGHTAILNPSMQGLVGSDTDIELNEVDVTLYTSWKDGLFAFRNQTLGQIMLDLSRWYDFKFWFENSQLKDIRFTGEIERYENPEALLNILEKTHEVKFEYNEGILLIK